MAPRLNCCLWDFDPQGVGAGEKERSGDLVGLAGDDLAEDRRSVEDDLLFRRGVGTCSPYANISQQTCEFVGDLRSKLLRRTLYAVGVVERQGGEEVRIPRKETPPGRVFDVSNSDRTGIVQPPKESEPFT